MGTSVGGRKGFVSEINVTPFVDVMLVLLIIFMVTAPMMTEGLDVELPSSQVVEVLPTEANHVVLTVRADGAIFLDTYQVTTELLATQLNATVTMQNKQLFLKADKDVPYGVVVDIMGRIKAAGIDTMGIVAEQYESTTSAAKVPSSPDNTGQNVRP